MNAPGIKPLTIQAIDVHGHYGQYIDPKIPLHDEFFSGSAELVAQRARPAAVEWTVVSPLLSLFPRGKANAATGNDEAAEIVPRTAGLLQWVVINPLQPETYRQAERMLATSRCVGIKIHPEEHIYHISEHGREIFEFAERHRAVVLTHSGEQNSLPEDFVPFANSFPGMKLILAHLGMGWDGNNTYQVRAMQQSKHGNLYTDTSSARSMWAGLIEWAVRELGPDRILFGSDTPLYSTGAQRMRIEHAEISDSARRKILSDNARQLLRLPVSPTATGSSAGSAK